MFVWRPVVYGGKSIRDRVFDWQAGGVPFKLIDGTRQFEHYFQQAPKKELDESRLPSALRDLIDREKKHFTTPAIPFMQGMDSSQPDPLEIEIVNKLQQFFFMLYLTLALSIPIAFRKVGVFFFSGRVGEILVLLVHG